MSLSTAFRRPRPLAGVLGFSGALLGAESLVQEVRSRPPVLLIHGDADDVVPVDAMFLAVEALQAAAIPAQWFLRPGLPHSIDSEGIEAGARFLKVCLAA
jgi:phospholipase/carboxylesterase